ncbi:hypothetical protein D3C78_1692320 [compost metagenome]
MAPPIPCQAICPKPIQAPPEPFPTYLFFLGRRIARVNRECPRRRAPILMRTLREAIWPSP